MPMPEFQTSGAEIRNEKAEGGGDARVRGFEAAAVREASAFE